MLWILVLYLLYGLSFFTLGIAILSRDISLSELGIARILWLLAAFGIVHGCHEWLELLGLLFPEVGGGSFGVFRLSVVALSFLFLLYFGIFLNIISFGGEQALHATNRLVKAMVGLAVLALMLVATHLDSSRGGDVLTRGFVAFPGALLSGIGLIVYSKVVRHLSSHVAGNFIAAGICMVIYSVLTGLVPSATVVPFFNIQVIVFRGLSALLIMVFTIRALSVFDVEQAKLVRDKLQRFSQSEKLASMGILAAGIAHEINNPLTNIAHNADMLKDLISGEPQAMRKLQVIERNIGRASRIAEELLHFSREKETAMARLDLNRILQAARHLLSS
jgi:signal transduction histidine kinase